MSSDIDKINSYFEVNEDKIVVKEELLKILSSFLDERRFKHSLSVGKLAYEIALNNGLDNPLIYYFSGLVHDIAKNKDKDLKIVDKYLNEEEKSYPHYMYHEFLGYYFIKEIFNINDEYILNSVKYHCSGKDQMSPIEMIIFSADKIDPLRNYDSKYMIDAMNKDYKTGFVLVLKENKKFIDEKNSKYDDYGNNALTKKCYEYYLK